MLAMGSMSDENRTAAMQRFITNMGGGSDEFEEYDDDDEDGEDSEQN
jgi:hypothetical protein